MSDVYLGLGANLGDRMTALSTALGMIDELDGTKVIAVSRAYETEPWGVADQPDYANAVAHVRTTLRADELLDALNDIEEALGRERNERFGARTIDIDILLFGDEEWDSERLTIPHPRLIEREFTVVPLLEIAPDVRLPDGSPVTREAAVHGRITGELGAIAGWEPKFCAPVLEGLEYVEPGIDSPDILEAAEQAVRGTAALPHRPIPAGDEWVELLGGMQGMMIHQQGSFDLQLKAGALESSGIPVLLDPPPIYSTPGVPHYGLMEKIRLLVPATYEREARELLDLPIMSHRDATPSTGPSPVEPARQYTSSYPPAWRAYAIVAVLVAVAGLLAAFWDTVTGLLG